MPNTRGPHGPQTVARQLLSAGTWVTAADYADLIHGALSDEQAVTCYGRLVRNGTALTPDRTEQIRIGRERLAQESLQRLVQRGEFEAVGTGSTRTYRMKGNTVFLPRPKPTRETLSFDTLRWECDLQMRDLGPGILFDDVAAQEYAERMEVGDVFPPLEIVREKVKGSEPIYWVFSGFTRGGAYLLRDVGSVVCLVYEGTYADAQWFALSENRRHGHRSTSGDKTKAVETLLDTPTLMGRVREAARDRAMALVIADACGVSERLVYKVLGGRGKKIQGAKLIDIAPVVAPLPVPIPVTDSDQNKSNICLNERTSTLVETNGQISECKQEADPVDPADEESQSGATTEVEMTSAIPIAVVRSAVPDTVSLPPSKAERIAVDAERLADSLEIYAESIEGQWILGSGPLSLGGPFVRDDRPVVANIVRALETSHTHGNGNGYMTAAQKAERQLTAETAARVRDTVVGLPRGCAVCVWLRELALTLRQVRT